MGFFDPKTNCVADILIGVTKDGEPRVMITTGGDGEGDHDVAVYPLRKRENAVEKI